MQNNVITGANAESILSTNKLIRNTYILLSMTLLFSAFTAAISVLLRMPPSTYLFSIGGAFLLMWFVLPKTANSSSGIGVVFLITGLLGFSLGPILNMYLALPNGPQIVATALGGTGIIFLGLSGYALTTKKGLQLFGWISFCGVFSCAWSRHTEHLHGYSCTFFGFVGRYRNVDEWVHTV